MPEWFQIWNTFLYWCFLFNHLVSGGANTCLEIRRMRRRNEPRRKYESCKRTDEIFPPLCCCLFFLLYWYVNSYFCSATSVRGSCTPSRNPTTFIFFLFSRGLEDAGESLWYKICYIVFTACFLDNSRLKHASKSSTEQQSGLWHHPLLLFFFFLPLILHHKPG